MYWLLTLVFAAALPAQEETRNPRTSAEDVAAGARTFRSHCSECHGLNGEGGRGPNLASGQFFHGSTDRELLKNISDGIAGTEMAGLFYSPDRVWQIVAYLRSLGARLAPVRGDVSRGLAIFRADGCTGCHRVRGEGAALGPDLTKIGLIRSPEHLRRSLLEPDADVRPRFWFVSATGETGAKHEGFLLNEDTYTVQFLDLKEQLRSLSKAGLSHYGVKKTSRMPSYQTRLSPQQVDDVVAYLSSLRGGQ